MDEQFLFSFHSQIQQALRGVQARIVERACNKGDVVEEIRLAILSVHQATQKASFQLYGRPMKHFQIHVLPSSNNLASLIRVNF